MIPFFIMSFLKTMRFFSLASFSALLLFPVLSYSSENEDKKIIIASDFDGTVTQAAGDKWITAVTAVRELEYRDHIAAEAAGKVLRRHNLSIEDLPYLVEITQMESFYLRNHFYKKNGAAPNFTVFKLPPKPHLEGRSKGVFIILGLYSMHYRDSFRIDSHLLRDYERAKERALKSGKKSLESLFNMGVDLINSNIESPNSEIMIHTARGQSPEAFMKLFKKMQEEGVLKGSAADLKKISVQPFSYVSGARYGADFHNRKIELLKLRLNSLRIEMQNNPSLEVHIVFAEDEIKYLYAANELFRASKEPHLSRVYMHVLYTGPSEYVSLLDAQNYRRFVTYHKGVQTPISKEHAELVGLPLERVEEMHKIITELNKPFINNCRKVFEGKNKGIKAL